MKVKRTIHPAIDGEQGYVVSRDEARRETLVSYMVGDEMVWAIRVPDGSSHPYEGLWWTLFRGQGSVKDEDMYPLGFGTGTDAS